MFRTGEDRCVENGMECSLDEGYCFNNANVHSGKVLDVENSIAL